jgi:hypothetical protein
VVLGELVAHPRARSGSAPRLGEATRRVLLKSIAKRRRGLRRQALKEGKRLYELPTRSFVRRVLETYTRAKAPTDA